MKGANIPQQLFFFFPRPLSFTGLQRSEQRCRISVKVLNSQGFIFVKLILKSLLYITIYAWVALSAFRSSSKVPNISSTGVICSPVSASFPGASLRSFAIFTISFPRRLLKQLSSLIGGRLQCFHIVITVRDSVIL